MQKEKPVREPRPAPAPKPKIVKPPKDNTYKGDRDLTPVEDKFLAQYIKGKWSISPDNKNDMTYYYRQQLSAGIALATVGSTLLVSGAVVTGVLCTVQRKYVRYYYPSENNHSKQDIQEEVTFEPDIESVYWAEV